MNQTFEKVITHMQLHRRPSKPTVMRVGAGAAVLVAFAFVCTLSFTSLCANLETEDTDAFSQTFNDVATTDVRAFDVTVEYAGKSYPCSVSGGCRAGEAVYTLGLDVDSTFVLDPPAQTELNDGDTVRVLPCTVRERTETEDVPFDTTFIRDDKLAMGLTRTRTKGRNGEQEVLYHDYYSEGECVYSERVSETVIREPVNAVCLLGTKKINIANGEPISTLAPADFQLDSNGAPKHYKSYFDGIATAYYGGGLTATGVPAAVGYVAVNPKVIPYNTRLWITSLDGEVVYGYAIAADTGGFAKGGWADVDLYMDTYDECVQFGKRGVRIYILSN